MDPLFIANTTILEKYAIEKAVGEGGFAVVYRARHTIWNKPVAIKFFHALASVPADQREKLQQAFIDEGALLTDLSSRTASIVQARDVGSCTLPDGRWMPFMVLEWLDGRNLGDFIDDDLAQNRPPWGLELIVEQLAPIAEALEVAHQSGVAHRDVKPGNIFVVGGDARMPGVVYKLLDFGVAKMMSDDTDMKAALAKTGQNLSSFTPQYGAPEQFNRKYGATGPWTDVFALAAVVVELLCNRTALEGDDVVQLAVSAGDPALRPTPAQRGVALPDAVEAVFLKAMAVSPAERYSSAGQFWAALADATGVTRQTRTSGVATTRRPVPPTVKIEPAMAATELATGPVMQTDRSMSKTAPQPRRGAGFAVVVGAGLAVIAVVSLVVVAGGWFGGDDSSESETHAVVSASSVAVAPSAQPPVEPCPDDMVHIKGGQYFQGSDSESALENEKPSHHVKLDAYCIDKNEVTVAQYKACSDIGKCRPAPKTVDWPGMKASQEGPYTTLCNASYDDRGEHPINCVDWDMARRYCRSLNRRLPTESEWEYATRGPDGRVYPWGDDEPTSEHLNACGQECVKWHATKRLANLAPSPLYDADDGYPGTAPVGSFPKGSSRFGPNDVVGNVWEWVADYYSEYQPGDVDNPKGPETGEKRVIRGGGFNGIYTTWLRPSFRYNQDPKARSAAIGFRCAMNPRE